MIREDGQESQNRQGIPVQWLLVFTMSVPGALCAQVAFDDRCSAPITHRRFVETALLQVQEGANREHIVGTLLCVTRNDRRSVEEGARAVRALFAIVEDEADIRKYLLEITADPQTSDRAHREACELLVYVADGEARQALLRQLRAAWPTRRWATYFAFFRELGDQRFLEWLEDIISDETQTALPASTLQREIRHIRIRESLEHLLKYLGSDETDLDGAWVVRQAFRHGATREQIRRAVLSRLRHGTSRGRTTYKDLLLVQECDKLRVLQPEDEPDVGRLRRVIEGIHVDSPGAGPIWAERRIAQKRAEFYGFNRERVDEQ